MKDKMPFTAQIDTEAEWNSIIQYLKTNVVPDSVTKTDRSNFKRRCRHLFLKPTQNASKEIRYFSSKSQ